jgi:hypothetical protein
MPGDYKKRLSAGDLDNLLAFLSRQSLRPRDEKVDMKEQSK